MTFISCDCVWIAWLQLLYWAVVFNVLVCKGAVLVVLPALSASSICFIKVINVGRPRFLQLGAVSAVKNQGEILENSKVSKRVDGADKVGPTITLNIVRDVLSGKMQ